VKAAAAAQPAWAALGLAARAAILRKLADGVDAAKPRLAAMEALNTGKPLREAEADVDDVRSPRAA
jgi:betaine-aldehyde dehydrogenase